MLYFYSGLRCRSANREPYSVLYNIPGVLALDIVDKDLHYLVTLGLTEEKQELIFRNCQKFWLKQGINRPVYIDLALPDLSYEGITIVSAVDNRIKVIIYREWQIAVINGFSELNSYNARTTFKPDMLVINSGGTLTIPSWLDITATRCIAVSSGLKGRLHIPEILINTGDSFCFTDVRMEGARRDFF